MADDDKPDYTLYRSKPRWFRRRDDDGGLRDMQAQPRAGGLRGARRRRPAPPPAAVPAPAPPAGRRIGVWRVLRWLRHGVVAWLAISLVLFLISAQIQSAKVSSDADSELGGAGYPLTSPNTILVLGSDARTKGSKEPGANKIGQPSRSDSILLLRIGGGHNATSEHPARHGRPDPRPRRGQDQRRLRLRRAGARDPHGRAVPRHPDQPPRRGQLRELPAADRRARRHHLPRRLRRLARSTAASRTAATRCA